jgi:nucleotide-binding universal stress UspA family protein
MPYATLMVPVVDSERSTARIGFACELADHFGCSLLGVAAQRPEPPLIEPNATMSVVGELVAAEREKAEAALKRAEMRFRAVTGPRKIPSEWRSTLSDPVTIIAAEARAADLLVIGRDSAVDLGDVLMSSGRPVLVTPPNLPVEIVPSHVVIAWTDSRESRRAIIDAMPFLQAAAQVTVLEVCGSDDVKDARARTADIVGFLARHTVKAEAVVRQAVGQSVAQRIIAMAREKQAGLIVMGGYGHARLREWAFGGVTREMLETSPVCLLLSR